MEFHPGGEEELMKGVGTDATELFNEVHKWVNFETMLQKCLVGRLVESRSFFLKPNFLPLGKGSKNSNKSDTRKNSSSSTNSLVPPTLGPPTIAGARSPLVSPMTPSALPNPKYDWFQTNTLINIAIYTKWKHINKEHVVVIKRGSVVKVVCYVQDMAYTVHLELNKPVAEEFELKTGSNSGKVDILLKKEESGVRWSIIGRTLEGHGDHVKSKDRKVYDDGALTPALDELTVGSSIDVSVPEGTFYFDKLVAATETATDTALLGAGTGITPMIRVTHVLSKAGDSWPGWKGHIRKDLLEKLLPVGNKERSIYLCVCGPTQFTKLGVNLFKELGYSSGDYHAFLG
ncbi:Cytochrome b5 reductase 4-like 2 [Homarus americanus]|uniref:cytochrome-b5 reductase n=1 Tax=Homarus americanus TaxID=6706 RepID=A0A8J5K7K3_HOMAM|nr:Cytochrome b5 reductase 4-like 2 [Homarus americanus]